MPDFAADVVEGGDLGEFFRGKGGGWELFGGGGFGCGGWEFFAVAVVRFGDLAFDDDGNVVGVEVGGEEVGEVLEVEGFGVDFVELLEDVEGVDFFLDEEGFGGGEEFGEDGDEEDYDEREDEVDEDDGEARGGAMKNRRKQDVECGGVDACAE